MTVKKILIMAGGTGGHVIPGLTLAEYFLSKNSEVHWLGTQLGIEARLVPTDKISLHFISIAGVRGKGIKTLLLAPFRLLKAIIQAAKIIRKIHPDIIIGMGGFASGPGGIAAWLLRYPLIIHEQNSKAGMTNQCLRWFAKKTLTAFPNVFSANKKIQLVGNPVRTELLHLTPPEERLHGRPKKMNLLVFGGSLGARAINQLLPGVLANIHPDERPNVIHQTGEKLYQETIKLYEEHNVEAKIVPFISNMKEVYEWADFVICRAGALSVAELCAVGLGAVLIPYPYAVDDHQTTNAKYLADHQAAYLLQERELTPEKLIFILNELYDSPYKRLMMAKAAYKLRRANTTEQIYQLSLEVYGF